LKPATNKRPEDCHFIKQSEYQPIRHQISLG